MNIQKFILKDVRCFEEKQEFNIRPLTFLVGENSTGKSTVLACMQALGDFVELKSNGLNFNVDPYQMGTFVDIVRKVGSRGGGRRDSFELGFEIQLDDIQKPIHLLVTFIERESGSEPVIQQLSIDIEDTLIVFEVRYDMQDRRLPDDDEWSKVTTDQGKSVYTVKVGGEEGLFFTLQYFGFTSQSPRKGKPYAKLLEYLSEIAPQSDSMSLRGSMRRFIPPYHGLQFESFAPVRSKPRRTYDPLREVEDPEGGSMPMTLRNMHQGDKHAWESMKKELVEFGKASGLFTGIEIKTFGRAVNNPFQLQVKIRGPRTSLVDVGYGVSQILPILVRIFNAKRETISLIQQPEVHLHPKAQAELCSSLIGLTKPNKRSRRKSFVIETHSDAMINRARIEIMQKKIKPEDVSLIYLEPSGNKSKVYNISFDAEANMIGEPKKYRDFFLKEYDKLLGFGD